jgi:hypothetical protein
LGRGSGAALRYAELESEMRRVLALVKVRDGDHTKELLEVEITKTAMAVIGKFSGLTGVLGGNPTLTRRRRPPAASDKEARKIAMSHSGGALLRDSSGASK